MQYWSDFILMFACFRPIERDFIVLIMPEIPRFYNRNVTLQILTAEVLNFSQA